MCARTLLMFESDFACVSERKMKAAHAEAIPGFHAVHPEAIERAYAEVFEQFLLARVRVETPVVCEVYSLFVPPVDLSQRLFARRAFRQEYLLRADAFQLSQEFFMLRFVELGEIEFSRGYVREGESDFSFIDRKREEKVVLVWRKEVVFKQGSGRYYPYHFTLHDALGRLRVLHLLAHGDLEPAFISLAI